MFSIQNNTLYVLSITSNIANIVNIAGIMYIPDTMFHIIERIDVSTAETVCIFLSPSKYFGANPTEARNTTDKNGRN